MPSRSQRGGTFAKCVASAAGSKTAPASVSGRADSVSPMSAPEPRLLVTDLDNTLWDWLDAWYASFSALMDGLVTLSGVDRAVLEDQVKAVHRRRGTSEYSNLVRELPALIEAAAPGDPAEVYREALRAQSSRRKSSTRLYPGVREGLARLRAAGVRIVAYTESGAFWTEWRIRNTGLDGIIDVLYSSPDHDLLAGLSPADLRTGVYDDSKYGLRSTEHRHVPHGVLKPSAQVLRVILEEQGHLPAEAVYLGDSLMKDIAMAQSAGVFDVHAAYGLAQDQPGYELLRRVTHWPEEDVARETELALQNGKVVPTMVCTDGFVEVLSVFELEAEVV